MDKIFADIDACDIVLERLFEFVSENRWITLLYNDNLLDDFTSENHIRWYIFSSFTDSLMKIYYMITSLQKMNNSLFFISHTQLHENDIFLGFKMFQALNFRGCQPINMVGYNVTIHYPILTYQRFSKNICMHVREIQEFCNVFSTQLEGALYFYNTKFFVENTYGSASAISEALNFSNMQDTEHVRFRLVANRQQVFQNELYTIVKAFHDC